ncbi:ribonuclease HII [Mycoplasmopsis alligatoris]|uniref:Ribonuclease n=1 Tax=Mycoplasmopsis alligatoris A21JP2 TaxID=747682 RepID=D4XWS1_9BACT|nr:ribonuclease HII [Mycoplasmopsis alligatoris]EFF41260.1 ribonuclease HII [Mycoplasmopsis alligatoris A21JP2]
MVFYESVLLQKYEKILGLDEVGRDSLAGPIVVACVMFPKNYHNPLIKDSKELTKDQRDIAYKEIIKDAITYKYIFLDKDFVDLHNPKKSSIIGMEKLIDSYELDQIDYVITDYEKVNTKFQSRAIKFGDKYSITIAAASIVAKVIRDEYMDKMSLEYPIYAFDKNKGYGTKVHLEALKKYGPSPIHRISYKPVKDASKI